MPIDNPGAGGYTEGARVYHSADQVIVTGTYVALAFDSERYDTDNIHDIVTNNSRLTCKTAGKYLIVANLAWKEGIAADRRILIREGGDTYIAYFELEYGGYVPMMNCTIWDLAVGEYVECIVRHEVGSNLTVHAAPGYSAEFMMQRIG